MKENWTYKKLGEVCDVKTGKLDANASDENGLYPFFTCSKEPLRINTYSYDAECILVAGNGDLNVKYYNGKFDAYQRTYIITLKNGITDISVRYLYCFFLLYVETLRKKSIGGVIKYIKLGDITDAKVHIPSLSEQQRIVSELDLLQSIIDKQQAQLKELDNLAQSIFYDMFGDPVENKKGWAKRPLQAICERITDGSHFSPKEDPEGKIPMLSVKDMGSNGFIYDKCKFINETDYAVLVANGCRPSYNDVLVAKDGSYLKTAFVLKEEIEQAILSSIAILKPKTDTVCPDYLAFFFKIPQTKLVVERHYLTGTAIKRVILKGFKELQLILPPMTLQQSFAKKIHATEKQKANISKSIKETQKLFDYTMDKYFG